MASSIVYDINEATDQNQEVPENMDFEDLWSNLVGKQMNHCLCTIFL